MIFDFNDGWTLTKENGESFSVCLPHDAMLGERDMLRAETRFRADTFRAESTDTQKHFKSTKVISAKTSDCTSAAYTAMQL